MAAQVRSRRALAAFALRGSLGRRCCHSVDTAAVQVLTEALPLPDSPPSRLLTPRCRRNRRPSQQLPLWPPRPLPQCPRRASTFQRRRHVRPGAAGVSMSSRCCRREGCSRDSWGAGGGSAGVGAGGPRQLGVLRGAVALLVAHVGVVPLQGGRGASHGGRRKAEQGRAKEQSLLGRRKGVGGRGRRSAVGDGARDH